MPRARITLWISKSTNDTITVCGIMGSWGPAASISSDRPVDVTYHWARSDGTRTAPVTVRVSPERQAQLHDDTSESGFTAAPGVHYRRTDTLQVTSPVPLSDFYAFSYTCRYRDLQITTSSLPDAVDGGKYNAKLSATGGDGTYRWSAIGLPPGFDINPASGLISGPVEVAVDPGSRVTYTATIVVTDGERTPQFMERMFPVTIRASA